MRKLFTTISISLVCGMMFCPITEAQGRGRNGGGGNNNGGGNHSTQTQQVQRSNNNAVSNNNKSAGSSSAGRNNVSNNGQRPGNMGGMSQSNNNNRNNNGNVNKGNNRNNNGNKGNNGAVNPGKVNPGNGGWNTHTPNAGNRQFGGTHAGSAHPGGTHGFHNGVPMRPYMPANHRWYRPTPPPSFRPYRGCPNFSTILGIAIGSALNASLDYLCGAGYNVLGYVSDAIYLSNVSMLNFMWPNATMYYSNNVLSGSEFTYSTSGYDRSRYNLAYNNLVRLYGSPVSVQNNGDNSVSATWWGYNNSYVTLSFYPDYAYNGLVRYYTTLSFGN